MEGLVCFLTISGDHCSGSRISPYIKKFDRLKFDPRPEGVGPPRAQGIPPLGDPHPSCGWSLHRLLGTQIAVTNGAATDQGIHWAHVVGIRQTQESHV